MPVRSQTLVIDIKSRRISAQLAVMLALAAPLTAPTADAADDDAALCQYQLTAQPDALGESPADQRINLESGRGRVTLGGDAILEDGVSASSGAYRIDADSGRYLRDKGLLTLDGNIRYRGAGSTITSQSAMLNYLYGEVEFRDAEFRLGEGAARGAASLLRLDRGGQIEFDGVAYTTCPDDVEDWMVRARSIHLDTEAGVGQAKGLSLRFKGVPIVYTPYLSFPISAQRKTGFLLPRVGQSARNGIDISLPWYWNIAPSFDATFTPRLLSRRGMQLDSEFRYLTRRSLGQMRVAHLPGDDLTGLDRTLLEWQNRTDFAQHWRAFVDFTDVSDDAYLEDLGGSLSSASATHLNRSLGLRYLSPTINAEARVTHYQTIDSLIAADQEPYRLLPALRMNGLWRNQPGGFTLGLDGEFTAFDRDVGVTGRRLHVAPSISLPLSRGGFYFEPQLKWLYTQYTLDEDTVSGDTTLTRNLPTGSVSAGVRFERELAERGLRQTLEPHIYYVHVPFRDQSDYPVFDTIRPITSIEQLYRSNRFVGLDRIGDTDQVTIGLTTRLINSEDGKSILTATLGQSRYLSAQGVTLPGDIDVSGNSSDYVAELSLSVWGNWNIDIAQQWGSEDNRTNKSEVRLQYLPGRGRVVNIGYRFRRDSVDQGDFSWSWPISSRWNAVGRYNYSFREQTTLERFVGLEYESCCWGLSIVSRRFISRRDGTADTAIAIQLELKGLTSVGDPVDNLLERGILGYRAD